MKSSQPNIEKKKDDMVIRIPKNPKEGRKPMPPNTKVFIDKKKEKAKTWCRNKES